MNAPENTVNIVLLHDGYPVESGLSDEVGTLTEEAMDFLPSGIPYLSEDLLAGPFWDLSDAKTHQRAGRCIVSRVKLNQTRLKIFGCEHAKPRRFIF